MLRGYVEQLTQPTLIAGRGDGVRYDEVVGPDGNLRPAWKGMAEVAVQLTPRDLDRVNGDIERFLADDGVTYARPGRGSGPWRLDPVPLVLEAAAWSRLEVGLAQRAELLNALLVDLYGEQRVLAERILPAAVVLGHPGFTRVVARPSMHDPRPLLLSATDLGRTAEGEWQVLADRTQAPSGMGYAMENRRVISRVMPELYREAGLHRVEPYFWALRAALIESAHGDVLDPRVVVLSPGTHSETSYDQAFMASTLGFPLVQGSDLVVRDGWVYMRLPGGYDGGRLERVDVILRRVDAAWSDPLELRGDSQLGVAGLVEAVRRGRVRVVNGLGAGVLENPALLAYLPALCEALLGESLRLPSVPTWWCGDPDGLERVLDRLGDRPGDLVVRRLDGPPLPRGADRDALRAQLLAEPHRFVAQQPPPLSQAPRWETGTVNPRPLSLRTFTLRYGSSYRPLVGGLASVYETFAGRERSTCSKDVWVLKAAPGDADQGLPEVLPMTSARAMPVLVPRILEDMWWFGRYAERTEDALRLVIATHAMAQDFRSRPRTPGGASLGVMLSAVQRLAGQRHGDLDAEFRSLLLDAERTGSPAHALAGLRDALAGVRDQLSPDTWRAFGTTDRAADVLQSSPHSHQIAESAGRMLTGILSLQGVTASMIRDSGWHMIGAGRALERGLQLCLLLRATTTVRRGIDVDRAVLNAVLQASESAVTHRRRYRGYVRPAGVLELLLQDPDNPRSLAFSLTAARDHLAALPASTGSSRPERLLEDLAAQVAATEVATLVTIGGVSRPNLDRFLGSVETQLTRLAEAVADLHLASGPAPRALDAMTLEPA